MSSLFGFLLGTVLSGGAVYSYLLQEYKTANDLLSEDIYVRLDRSPTSRACHILCRGYLCRGCVTRDFSLLGTLSDFANADNIQTLQASVTRLSNYVRSLEDRVQGGKK
jgi:hypothetical protein